MAEERPPDHVETDGNKKKGGVRGFFFGSVPRIFGTVVMLFVAVMIFNIYSKGNQGGQAPKKEVATNKNKQAINEVQAVANYGADKNKSLEDENRRLKEELAAKNAGTNPINVQPGPGAPQSGMQAPPFQPAPGANVPPNPMDAIKISAQRDAPRIPAGPQYSPMQRVTVDLRASGGLIPQVPVQVQGGAAVTSAHASPLQGACPAGQDCNTEKNMLGGSRAIGVLSHGVAAVEKLPYPMTIDLTTMTHGPNNTSVQVRDCSVLAVGTADISSSRVMMQLKELNCYINGEYVNAKTDGYVVDAGDQSIGLKGDVERNTGSYLLQMFLGSAMGGFGAAMAQSQVTTTYSAATGTGSSLVTGNALQYGAGQAGNNAAQQYAKRMESEADKILPYVNVHPQDRILVFFTASIHMPDSTQPRGISRELSSYVK